MAPKIYREAGAAGAGAVPSPAVGAGLASVLPPVAWPPEMPPMAVDPFAGPADFEPLPSAPGAPPAPDPVAGFVPALPTEDTAPAGAVPLAAGMAGGAAAAVAGTVAAMFGKGAVSVFLSQPDSVTNAAASAAATCR